METYLKKVENDFPANICLFKVSNRNTKKRCEICYKLSGTFNILLIVFLSEELPYYLFWLRKYSQICLQRTPAVPKISIGYNQVSAVQSFGFFGQKKTTEIKMEDFFHMIRVNINKMKPHFATPIPILIENPFTMLKYSLLSRGYHVYKDVRIIALLVMTR